MVVESLQCIRKGEDSPIECSFDYGEYEYFDELLYDTESKAFGQLKRNGSFMVCLRNTYCFSSTYHGQKELVCDSSLEEMSPREVLHEEGGAKLERRYGYTENDLRLLGAYLRL